MKSYKKSKACDECGTLVVSWKIKEVPILWDKSWEEYSTLSLCKRCWEEKGYDIIALYYDNNPMISSYRYYKLVSVKPKKPR